MATRNRLAFLCLLVSLGFTGANGSSRRDIPVYKAHGPEARRGHYLKNAYDGRKNAEELTQCYHSLNKGAGTVHFEIPLSHVEYVGLLNRGDTKDEYITKNIERMVVYGCQKTGYKRSCCTKYEKLYPVISGYYANAMAPEGSVADEIRVVMNLDEDDAYFYFCDIKIVGNILAYGHSGEFEDTCHFVPIRGALGPPPLPRDFKNILQVFDRVLDRARRCYVTDKTDYDGFLGPNKVVKLYIDRAKVRDIRILNGVSKQAGLMDEIEVFEVSACQRDRFGIHCADCTSPKPAKDKHWYDSNCSDVVADEIHITRNIKHGDENVHLWLCEVEVFGMLEKPLVN